ncbi:CBS domain-containing protein [Archaeoglobus veneficus]|uniref:Putative signal transduction protein with CBS domains n=1 Tax=Archaeoglobus veneficus (strain DSM 11195 / SNP6) TaxID=693661 RepID=F2KPH8_ARCVS|nr:CBS domain-containing protein [Archaeoglobus veneficus]AEA46409.1 putative signal transduction protein with CBS domains [Archaeoglobus veneficus SNP6]
MRIGDVMVRDVVSVDYKTPVKDVCKIMGEKKIGSVIVTRDGKAFGIFTERDLLSKVLLEGSLDEEVGKYASTPLIVITPDYDVREAARIMADMKIKRLVVMEDEEVKGIFTSADLARVIAESSFEG